MIGIYKITSPSGRVYIGQSRDINQRIKRYSGAWCKRQIKLYNSILKYGWINHVFEVIEECLFEELNNKERYWQEFYNCVDNGLNCQYVRTDTQPKIISEEMKRNIGLASSGRKHSEESRLKMSASQKKRDKSYINDEYIKNRSGLNHWAFGKGFSDEHKRNLSLSFTGNRMGLENHKTNIILDMNTGIFYIGFQEAAEAFNVKYDTVKSWLKGKRPNKTSLQIV